MRKLVAAGAGMLALVAFPASAAAATRHVWIAAVPTIWNVVPNERNAIEGERYTVDKTTMRTVVYERFTRNWKRKLPAQTRIPGPLLKARVGDEIFIHFKNNDTRFKRPHSMHFHGVHYPFGSEARSSPASRAPAPT
jgi:FtsP/CotA-like multicopper oxidase with cupredoxin domain